MRRVRVAARLAVAVLAIAATARVAVANDGALVGELRALAGPGAVVYAVDERDRELIDIDSRRPFLPASTLKLFTALLALDRLGGEWHFETEVWERGDDLVVRGKGDPFLVSEEVERLAAQLSAAVGRRRYRGLAIDDSFFTAGLRIPGVGRSTNPYDALNTATAVNFNTAAVTRRGKSFVSAEPQTPLTATAARLARERGVTGTTRLQLGHDRDRIARHTGELIGAKLRAAGVAVGEHVASGGGDGGREVYVHRNQRSLMQVCRDMLYSSNNFVANQLFLAVGAAAYGAPATLEKSQRAAERFVAQHPELRGLEVVEGSGIAYENRVTAAVMVELLRLMEPYKELMRREHGTRHKTGTLKAIATIAGFLDTARHGVVRYVVAVPGGQGEKRWRIIAKLRQRL